MVPARQGERASVPTYHFTAITTAQAATSWRRADTVIDMTGIGQMILWA